MSDMEEIKQTLHTMMGMLEGVVTALGGLDNRVGRLEEGQATINSRLDKLEEGQANIVCRLDKLEEGQANIVCRLDKLEEGQARLEAGQAAMECRLDKLEAGQMRLETGHRQIIGLVNKVLGDRDRKADQFLYAGRAMKESAHALLDAGKALEDAGPEHVEG